MRRRFAATAVAAVLATAIAVPARASGDCTAFAVPPHQRGTRVNALGGVACAHPRQVDVTVCAVAFLWFAGHTILDCAEASATGRLVTASVDVCPDPQFPLVYTQVTATAGGEQLEAFTPYTPGVCPG